MKIQKYLFSVIIFCNTSLFSQSGTFDFTSGVTESGDPIKVMQTVSGVTCTLSTNNSDPQDDVIYETDPDFFGYCGTTGPFCYNHSDEPSADKMVVTFSQSVNITTMRIGQQDWISYTMTFTPNTGTAQNHAIDGFSGTTVTLNFIGVLSITITQQGGGNNNVVIDNIIMDASLPVELISFTNLINKNVVVLNWQTATEVENYGFEIERASSSTTPIRSWEKIGFVEGHGNSNSPKNYSFTDNSVSPQGKYLYRLKQIDTDGSYEFSHTVEADFGTPHKFELEQNFPNPFNPMTTIKFSLAEGGYTTLKVYDMLGEEVAVLVNEFKHAGSHEINFDASSAAGGLSSGVYVYRLTATSTEGHSQFSTMKKFIVSK